jgi:hypothetical protein
VVEALIDLKIYGGSSMVMEEIPLTRAKTIAKRKGLKPGRVKGTNGVQFTKGEKTLKRRRLAVYESGGWMKIMKKRR